MNDQNGSHDIALRPNVPNSSTRRTVTTNNVTAHPARVGSLVRGPIRAQPVSADEGKTLEQNIAIRLNYRSAREYASVYDRADGKTEHVLNRSDVRHAQVLKCVASDIIDQGSAIVYANGLMYSMTFA